MGKETVLVVGATGNIGISTVIGALRSGHNVLAVVRNQESAKKLFQHVGTKEGITTVEADITSENGVKGVVDKVEKGDLPAFQHVFGAAGGLYGGTPMSQLTTKEMRETMNVNFESNFYAYRATIPYLLSQSNPKSTWTICTGAQGDVGSRAAPAMSQGALYSMANAGCSETEKTNVRFNELYLVARVDVDSVAEKSGSMKASDFGKAYQQILKREDVKGCRVQVFNHKDLEELKFGRKVPEGGIGGVV